MTAAIKIALAAVPVLAIVLVLRACARGEAERWLEEVAEYDARVGVVIDEPGLIVLAPDPEWGRRAGPAALAFRDALTREHADLVGSGRAQRLVLVAFSDRDSFRRYAADRADARLEDSAGYHDPARGAIVLPMTGRLDVLRHETTHLVASQSWGARHALSPWLTEGLAVVFERYDPTADPPRPPGLPPFERPESVDVERLIALQDYGAFLENDPARNYREAAALTAFLIERDRKGLAGYITRELHTTQPRDVLFRNMFRPDREEFRAALRAWLTSGNG